ncbi:hypothetical protein [Myxococcus sp. RHSTA-1-4]|uniref:hypothetical protein n=1 Tax=Myxococcus sp. RHSTA-1-4 TaxID=2874601 RepID=UPI001CBEECDE|nr:hypothetical protein [Myxococcus sp. RHSTA-1-4]MBZ4421109.1 hypothetical protein [Myxococcus sp. RHSTA-1-4]
MNRESRRVERHSRLLWSVSRTEAAFEQFTRVEVRSHHRAPDEVVLQGAQPGRAIVLARSHDRDEVLELARAASRVLGGGLQVDGGHTRSVDERLSAAPLRETQPSPPMGSHIRVARESGVLTVTLPARGWRPLYVAQAGIATLVGVAGPILFGWAWARSQGWTSANVLKPAVGCLVLFVCGSYLLWRVMREATSGWLIKASSRGLEVSRHGRWASGRLTRIAASKVWDIDLRVGTRNNLWGERVVVDYEGGDVAVGTGLPRESLEWTEAMLRRALATRPDSHRPVDASARHG